MYMENIYLCLWKTGLEKSNDRFLTFVSEKLESYHLFEILYILLKYSYI